MTTAPTYTGTYTAADAPASGPDRVAPLLSRAAEKRLAELDVANSQSLLFFGSTAQSSLSALSDSILEQVRSKDLGGAGEALSDMVLTLRGFDKTAADEGRPVGWLGRMLGKTRGAARLLQRYEAARDQIDAIGARLQRHQNDLLLDIETLDRLYAANLTQVHELEAYIDAGDTALAGLEKQLAGADATPGAGPEDTLDAQRLRDLRLARDNLERRVHDLRLTRQVALQALPSIRLVQDNDRSLVAQIDSTLVNTVPLWRQQLAQAVTIQRARDAAQTVAAANDLTNELLRANAENLRAANRETREQAERGVFDVEAIAEANRVLIGTIEDSLRIADEGRAARSKAVGELREMEQQLRRALAAARASGQ